MGVVWYPIMGVVWSVTGNSQNSGREKNFHENLTQELNLL